MHIKRIIRGYYKQLYAKKLEKYSAQILKNRIYQKMTQKKRNTCTCIHLKKKSNPLLKTFSHKNSRCSTCCGSAYTKTGVIQRRLAWLLSKDNTQNSKCGWFHWWILPTSKSNANLTKILPKKSKTLNLPTPNSFMTQQNSDTKI